MTTMKRLAVVLGVLAVLATAAPARAHSIFFAVSVPGFAFVAAPPPPPVYYYAPCPRAYYYAGPPVFAATFGRHDYGRNGGGWRNDRRHRWHH